MREIQLIRNTNTRARITIARDRITIIIPRHYSYAEEYAFMELVGELPYYELNHVTMRGRDSMSTYLILESDSRKIKTRVEKEMI